MTNDEWLEVLAVKTQMQKLEKFISCSADLAPDEIVGFIQNNFNNIPLEAFVEAIKTARQESLEELADLKAEFEAL